MYSESNSSTCADAGDPTWAVTAQLVIGTSMPSKKHRKCNTLPSAITFYAPPINAPVATPTSMEAPLIPSAAIAFTSTAFVGI